MDHAPVEVPWHHDELTVGELAARSGVAVSALHFYERQGLISSRRTAGNQRRYRRDALRRVAFIRVSQRVGIPLATIGQALATLPDDRTPDVRDWERISTAWQAELDARIEQLSRLRDHLADCIGCGCLSLRTCRLANPQDELRHAGPGPRRLLVEALDRPALDRPAPDRPAPDRPALDRPAPDRPAGGHPRDDARR